MAFNFGIFISESRRELKKVNWPSRKDTIRFTVFVVVFSLAFSALLGLFDFSFVSAVKFLIS